MISIAFFRTSKMRLFLCLFLVMGLASCENVKVKTGKGTVKGKRVDHDFGQYYYSFRGIRYAKPPTEELRFMVIVNEYFYLLRQLFFNGGRDPFVGRSILKLRFS
jgi:hypothetical protein